MKAPGFLRIAGAAAALGLLWSSPLCADSAASKNNEGNRLYNQKRFDDALKLYTDAQATRPQAPELHYNIGNVLFRKGEYDKAVEEYLRAQAAPDRALSQAATYNRGNALLMQKQFQQAVNAYVQALRADPKDQDAKRNLELALKMMQEQKKQQQQKQDQKQQDQKQQDQKQNPSPQNQQAQQNPNDPKKGPQPKDGQMSPEEAKQILEALKDEEKPMELDRARAIADVARVIVDSAKVEVDFLKVTGALRSTDFLPTEEDETPRLPAAVPRKLR